MQVTPYGRSAVLVRVPSDHDPVALAEHLRSAVPAAEIVPGADTVLVDGISGPEGRDAVRRAVGGWVPSGTSSGPLVEIPTVYDGPDLADIARHWGVAPEEVVARHQEQEYTSRFCGFAPGFAYLTGLPDAWAVPRLDSPRTRVPAGSVALAGAWCGIYPTASPGGWRLLGRTDTVLWDPDRDPPALLAPGTRVRFVVA